MTPSSVNKGNLADETKHFGRTVRHVRAREKKNDRTPRTNMNHFQDQAV